MGVPVLTATQQYVDALFTLPPDHLRQTLQMALDCAGLDEVATLQASSLDMPASALLQDALAVIMTW